MNRNLFKPVSAVFLCLGLTAVCPAQDAAPGTGLKAGARDRQAETKPAEQPARTDLPTAESILADAEKAMGGREAFEAVESATMKGNVSMMGMEMTIEMHRMDDKMYSKTLMPQMNMEQIQVYNGEVGWSNNPMGGGWVLMEPAMAEQMSRNRMIGMVQNFQEQYDTLETVDESEFEGATCYKIKMANEDGSTDHSYFNTDSGLISGVESNEGGMTNTMVFKEWKQYGDIKMFTQMVIKSPMGEGHMTFTEITFNKVDPVIFAMPEEVKKLLEERESKGDGDGDSPTTQPSTAPGG